MATPIKKRKLDVSKHPRKPSKKLRSQQDYSSGSSSEAGSDGEIFARDVPKPIHSKGSSKFQDGTDRASKGKPVRMDLAAGSQHKKGSPNQDSNAQQSESEQDSDEDLATDASSDYSANESMTQRKTTKRHDPDVFATSMATILSSKLSVSKRVDPVLVRSKAAQSGSSALVESKLEAKARRTLRDEKRQAKEQGHVKDVLLGEAVGAKLGSDVALDTVGHISSSASAVAEQERRLRKTAQRGVVKLFNAVRAAQVRSEEAARAMREKGVVGQQKREQTVGEMGRNAFLEMVSGGGKVKK